MENPNSCSFKTSSCIVRPRRRAVTMPYQVNSDGCHGKLCDKLLCKLFSANIVLLLICSVSVVISQTFCLLNPIEWTRRIVKFDVPATTSEWWRFRMEKSSQQRFFRFKFWSHYSCWFCFLFSSSVCGDKALEKRDDSGWLCLWFLRTVDFCPGKPLQTP